MVTCPICGRSVKEIHINKHLDSGCVVGLDLTAIAAPSPPPTQFTPTQPRAAFFQTPRTKATETIGLAESSQNVFPAEQPLPSQQVTSTKRELAIEDDPVSSGPPAKKQKNAIDKVAPLAERMRPRSLDDVYGQELVNHGGVIRSLIDNGKVPSMILWGGPGTGKTTIARLIAQAAGTRFVEINSTSTGVAEVKKLFADARNELSLTGRKTIVFCDEIHRFTKSQQDVFLGPVEAGIITLVGATTENPSFKVISALLSRCRTFTLAKLTDDHIFTILKRALDLEPPANEHSTSLITADEHALLRYLASFADGDARTALNLLSLALDLSSDPTCTISSLKFALTKTLVYDRAGDQHYDTISALHKSIRGSNADAALYYLARMLASGEDPLYIARRMVVIASEDVGLADNTLLPLAIAGYTAAEKIGMPECRINLAHVCVALCQAPKSTRAYRGIGNAMHAIQSEPGVGGLSIPIHLRNAPTRLMKEIGYGKGYKYNPKYKNGRVKQDYLPETIKERIFLEDNDLGNEVDSDLEDETMTVGQMQFTEHSTDVPETNSGEHQNGVANGSPSVTETPSNPPSAEQDSSPPDARKLSPHTATTPTTISARPASQFNDARSGTANEAPSRRTLAQQADEADEDTLSEHGIHDSSDIEVMPSDDEEDPKDDDNDGAGRERHDGVDDEQATPKAVRAAAAQVVEEDVRPDRYALTTTVLLDPDGS